MYIFYLKAFVKTENLVFFQDKNCGPKLNSLLNSMIVRTVNISKINYLLVE